MKPQTFFSALVHSWLLRIVTGIEVVGGVLHITNKHVDAPDWAYPTVLLAALLFEAWRISGRMGAQQVPPTRQYSYDVFLAAPMASLKSAPERQAISRLTDSAISALRRITGLERVYYAGDGIAGPKDYDPASVAFTANIKSLNASRLFILIYHKEVPTSALIEAGYALAIGMPSIYFVQRDIKLPYLLRQISQTPSTRAAICEFDGAADLATTLTRHAADMMGTLSGRVTLQQLTTG